LIDLRIDVRKKCISENIPDKKRYKYDYKKPLEDIKEQEIERDLSNSKKDSMDSKFSSGGSIGANSRHDKNYNTKERPLDRYFTTTCGIMKEFKSRRAFTFRGSAGGGSFRPRSHWNCSSV
jgi:hypothetical protein